MPIDISGYQVAHITPSVGFSGIYFGGTQTKIAPIYGIVDPMLPAVFGAATANGAYKVYPFPVNDTNINIGPCWSGTVFTCPVSGIYYTSYSGIVGNGTTTAGGGYYALIRNGAVHYFSYRDTDNIWELHHLEVITKCVAGDTLAWAMNTAPGPDSGGPSGAYQANHNTCTMWLIG